MNNHFNSVKSSLSPPSFTLQTNQFEAKQKRILLDISEHQPTTITDIAERLSVSESTISRQVARLADLRALEITQKGKTKELRVTLTGKLLL